MTGESLPSVGNANDLSSSGQDPLTDEQRQRLAVLYATRDALHVEIDALDLIRCAHWIATGQEFPAPLLEHFSPDAATWTREDEP